MFPFSVHSTLNLPAWRTKDTNITLMSFLSLFTQAITPERKVSLQNYFVNVVKIDKIREE